MIARACFLFFFQEEDGIRDYKVTGVQTCALPISSFQALLTSFSSSSKASQAMSAVCRTLFFSMSHFHTPQFLATSRSDLASSTWTSLRISKSLLTVSVRRAAKSTWGRGLRGLRGLRLGGLPTWTIKAQVIGSKEGGGCREMWGESIVETCDRQALRLPTAVPRLPRRDGRSVCILRPCPYVAPDRLAAVSPLGRSSAAHRDTGGRPGFSAPRRTRYGRADPRLRHPAG